MVPQETIGHRTEFLSIGQKSRLSDSFLGNQTVILAIGRFSWQSEFCVEEKGVITEFGARAQMVAFRCLPHPNLKHQDEGEL